MLDGPPKPRATPAGGEGWGARTSLPGSLLGGVYLLGSRLLGYPSAGVLLDIAGVGETD